jgi:hypothetical protein
MLQKFALLARVLVSSTIAIASSCFLQQAFAHYYIVTYSDYLIRAATCFIGLTLATLVSGDRCRYATLILVTAFYLSLDLKRL